MSADRVKTLLSADYQNDRYVVADDEVSRRVHDWVWQLVHTLQLAQGMLHNVDPETHLRPTNAEEWQRANEASEIVRHHIGESEGGYCGLCYLQSEVERVLKGAPDCDK